MSISEARGTNNIIAPAVILTMKKKKPEDPCMFLDLPCISVSI